jgi:hypothetical protein
MNMATEKLAKDKLEAFERIQSEFEASFHFIIRTTTRADAADLHLSAQEGYKM